MLKYCSHIIRAVIGSCALASCGVTVRAETPEANSYAPLEFLVGGTWIAPLPADKSGAKRTLEAHFTWMPNHRGVQFESAWVTGEKRAPYVNGLYVWDPAKQKLAIFYTDAGGDFTSGTLTASDRVLVHDLSDVDSNGTSTPVRTHLTKIDENVFTNEVLIQKDGAWTKVAEVRYERQR